MDRYRVAVCRGQNYSEVVMRALVTCKAMDNLQVKGKNVFIKPNIVGPSKPGAGRVTDWRVVQAIIDAFNEAGASSITVGECPVEGVWHDDMEKAGYFNISGASLIDTDVPEAECVEVMGRLTNQPFLIPKAYYNADITVSVPILKTHFAAGVTLGMKNIGIGIPPKSIYWQNNCKGKLHKHDINMVIPDVCSGRMPDLTVIDGIVGGEGKGPTEPQPVNSNVIIAGLNTVATDFVGCRVMGIDPSDIAHLTYSAQALSLGPTNIEEIDISGDGLSWLSDEEPFRHPPNMGYPLKRTIVVSRTRRSDKFVTLWHDGSALHVVYTSELPIHRCVCLMSRDMPFDDPMTGRHARVVNLDYIFDSNSNEMVVPLCNLDKPLEMWMDFGIINEGQSTCTLWSGSPFLGQYTDPTSAGRVLFVPW